MRPECHKIENDSDKVKVKMMTRYTIVYICL